MNLKLRNIGHYFWRHRILWATLLFVAIVGRGIYNKRHGRGGCSCGGDCGACGGCYKYAISRKYEKPKGDRIMRIAVTYENGQVFQHFGHTEQFKIYDVEEGKVIASEVADTDGQGHGALAGVLSALGADVIICGGIGGGAVQALTAAGIQLYAGVSGDADQAVEELLTGKLSPNAEANCDHHGHGEGHHDCKGHGEGHHGCGGHGEGHHGCGH